MRHLRSAFSDTLRFVLVSKTSTAAPVIYFVSLPGWFLAASLYIVCSRLLQTRTPVPVGAQA